METPGKEGIYETIVELMYEELPPTPPISLSTTTRPFTSPSQDDGKNTARKVNQKEL